MKDDPLYLHKKHNGVYQYRRPIVKEDQSFWRGQSGAPKKEWSRSLRTKDRREAIALLADAADQYEAERAEHLLRHRQKMPSGAPQEPIASLREQEEREAREALEAARIARHEARRELRTQVRQRMMLSTAELSPDEAAWRDLIRERDLELEKLQEAAAGQREANDRLRGWPVPSGSGRTVEALITA